MYRKHMDPQLQTQLDDTQKVAIHAILKDNKQPGDDEPKTPEDHFRKFVEGEVLKVIKGLAETADVSNEKIQAIAKYTLEMIQPGMSLEQLYLNAIKLDDTYTELCPIVAKVMNQYEEKYSKKALTHVSRLIKDGQYDAAQDMVKKVLMFKIFK
jgi:hypothetical protein